MGVFFPGNLLSNPEHEPAVEENSVPGRCVRHDLFLNGSQFNQIKFRSKLEAVQYGNHFPHFLNGCRCRIWHRVKVYKYNCGTPLHGQIGRHRGIDTTGKHDNHLSANAHRQTSLTGNSFRIYECFVFKHLDVTVGVRLSKVNLFLHGINNMGTHFIIYRSHFQQNVTAAAPGSYSE